MFDRGDRVSCLVHGTDCLHCRVACGMELRIVEQQRDEALMEARAYREVAIRAEARWMAEYERDRMPKPRTYIQARPEAETDVDAEKQRIIEGMKKEGKGGA